MNYKDMVEFLGKYTLEDTAKMMLSDDWVERLTAETVQAKIRVGKLDAWLGKERSKANSGKGGFYFSQYDTLYEQLLLMKRYETLLWVRLQNALEEREKEKSEKQAT